MRSNIAIVFSFLVLFFQVNAFAFPPELNIGDGMFVAKADCAGMNIKAGDAIYSAGDYTHFRIAKFAVPPQTKDTVLFNYSAPIDGTYYFTGDAGLQEANEFLTNTWSGGDFYDFKGNDKTGDLIITHSGPSPVASRCVLTNNTGG
jgi:hypothetical protein